jgi:hypothetical protein
VASNRPLAESRFSYGGRLITIQRLKAGSFCNSELLQLLTPDLLSKISGFHPSSGARGHSRGAA